MSSIKVQQLIDNFPNSSSEFKKIPSWDKNGYYFYISINDLSGVDKIGFDHPPYIGSNNGSISIAAHVLTSEDTIAIGGGTAGDVVLVFEFNSGSKNNQTAAWEEWQSIVTGSYGTDWYFVNDDEEHLSTSSIVIWYDVAMSVEGDKCLGLSCISYNDASSLANTLAGTTITRYTVTFNMNGVSEISAPSSITNIGGVSFTFPSVTSSNYNYELLGWAENSNATTYTHLAGATEIINGNVTYYAVWKKVTVTYKNLPEGDYSERIIKGSNYTIYRQAAKSGYTFTGWTPSFDATKTISNNTQIRLSSDTTFTANWEIVEIDYTLEEVTAEQIINGDIGNGDIEVYINRSKTLTGAYQGSEDFDPSGIGHIQYILRCSMGQRLTNVWDRFVLYDNELCDNLGRISEIGYELSEPIISYNEETHEVIFDFYISDTNSDFYNSDYHNNIRNSTVSFSPTLGFCDFTEEDGSVNYNFWIDVKNGGADVVVPSYTIAPNVIVSYNNSVINVSHNAILSNIKINGNSLTANTIHIIGSGLSITQDTAIIGSVIVRPYSILSSGYYKYGNNEQHTFTLEAKLTSSLLDNTTISGSYVDVYLKTVDNINDIKDSNGTVINISSEYGWEKINGYFAAKIQTQSILVCTYPNTFYLIRSKSSLVTLPSGWEWVNWSSKISILDDGLPQRTTVTARFNDGVTYDVYIFFIPSSYSYSQKEWEDNANEDPLFVIITNSEPQRIYALSLDSDEERTATSKTLTITSSNFSNSIELTVTRS